MHRIADCVDRDTEPVYWGAKDFRREAALLGHEYEDENDDDGHGCSATGGIGNVCALPLRVLIEEQHAKIEPAIKKFQQECSGHTDSQACKEEHEALVKALNGFLSLVQNGFKVIDAHANDASDADYQKQMEALRARAQQHLDWGREQLAALQ